MESDVRSLIRNYILFNLQREEDFDPLYEDSRRTIKRLSAFNLLRRNQLRLRTVAACAKMRKNRRWWVRPIFLDRQLAGAWFSLIPVMREFDEEAFFNFLRMTPSCFDWLLEQVSDLITKESTRRESISAGERLAVTLRYLASGDSQISISYLFRISDSAVSEIILETTAAIWCALKDVVFEPLTPEFWRRKSAEFEAKWDFPMCLGAIDGKHCTVQKFPMRGSECYNYKFGNSIVLLAVSDAKYKFIAVDVGARGREHDAGVFDRSEFGMLYDNHQLKLPPSVYNNDLMTPLPYVFIGDNAFALDTHLIVPFESSSKPEEVVFNYRLSRARRVVENAFGILAARFRVFRTNMIGTLHNLHLVREDSIPPRQRVYLPEGYADVYKSNGHIKKGRWRNENKDVEN
ncbi:hypothetical protein FOCC_FOCC016250, partial [Frankliniella occidentalis]